MRRRKDNGAEDHFDLLPFIAILLCTLGCLLFVTLAIASLNLGASTDVWSPKDATNKKIPILVEWDGTTATVQLETGDVMIPFTWGPDGFTPTNDGINQLISLMASRSVTQYTLFAVRPSGFSTFRRIAYQFRERNLDIGYEPEPQNKRVRLDTRYLKKHNSVTPTPENHS